MKIDWSNIISATSIAAAIASAIGYALKKSFERILDARLKQAEEKSKAAISELTRRKAAIYDQQVSTLKTATSLVYRSRNTARTVKETAIAGGIQDKNADIKTLLAQHAAIRELLYLDVAILPEEIFKSLHRLGHNLQDCAAALEPFGKRRAKNTDPTGDEKRLVEEKFILLDTDYQQLVSLVHRHLGVTEAS